MDSIPLKDSVMKLDNKGIDIQGKPGAQARAIFDGGKQPCSS